VGKITQSHEQQVDDRPWFTSSPSPSSSTLVFQFLAISATYSISLLNGARTVAQSTGFETEVHSQWISPSISRTDLMSIPRLLTAPSHNLYGNTE